MPDSSDTSNCSVIFFAEQKTVQVEVHPHPPTPTPDNIIQEQNSNSSNFVPDTQGEVNNSSTSENQLFVIFQKLVSKPRIIFTNCTKCIKTIQKYIS